MHAWYPPFKPSAEGEFKAITPEVINSTSAVTASLNMVRGILPATINSTSTVTAALSTEAGGSAGRRTLLGVGA